MSQFLSSKTSIDLQQSTKRQIIYAILVASCSISTGMCLGWEWYVTDMAMDDCTYCSCKYHSKMLKNILYVSAIFSAGPAAFAASLFGLKTVLIFGLLFTASGSTVIMYAADALTFPWLWFGRILHGLGAGIVFVIVPNYASENISRQKTRSALIGLHYLNLLVGVLLSEVINAYYVYSFVNIATIAMVVFNLVTTSLVSDPPYYRLKCDSRASALDFELKVLNSRLSNESGRLETGLKKGRDTAENCQQPYLLRPIIISICLIGFQQITGFLLLTSKLKCLYGILHVNEIPDAVAITLLQVIMCIISLCFLFVGVLGKKALLFISGFGMAVTLFLMNFAFKNEIKDNIELRLLILIFIYVICYSIGYGPIPWILMPELCQKKLKLWTSGMTVSVYATLSLVNNQYFSEYTQHATVFDMDIIILTFTTVSVIGVIFIITCVPPETKD